MSEDFSFVHEDTQPLRPVVQPVPRQTGQPPPVRRKSGGGCGCWLPALITAFLVAVLVIVGLFLPPVDLYNRLFGPQYAMLSAQSNAVASDGLTLIVNPTDPGQDFGVQLAALSASDFSAGKNATWAAEALAAVPPNLALQSAVYSIATTGTTPGETTLSVDLPATVGNTDILDLYAWDANAGQWTFIPSHASSAGTASGGKLTATVRQVPTQLALFQAAPPDQPKVLVAVDVTQTLTPDVAQLATIISPAGLQPTLQGTLTGSLAPGFDLNAGYLVLPVIRNFTDPRALDPDTIVAILGNSGIRDLHATQIAAFASGGYDGVMIDYRDLPANQRDNFSAFITDLGAKLHSENLMLGVVVPAATNNAGTWDTGAYDWQAIGAAADVVQVDLGLDPSTFAPGSDKLVEAMTRWAVGEVSRYKLALGLSALSVRQAGSDFTTIGFGQALSGLGDVTVNAPTTAAGTINPGSEIQASLNGLPATPGMDVNVQSPYLDYTAADGSTTARMWLTNGQALRFRMDRTAPFALGGVAFEDLLAPGLASGVLPAILNYKLQVPAAPSSVQLALRWRIDGPAGVVGREITDLNQPLITTLQVPDGNYAVNVAVVGGDSNIPRGGAPLAVFAPTATPTPIPTATPTPTPTATPLPVQVVQAPSGPVSAPGAGSIAAGSFEYGGQVTGTNTGAIGAMQRAGMNWMKVQVRFSEGDNPGEAAQSISQAHAAGFKILVSIPGAKDQLGADTNGFIQQYASFVGGVAALGPDAIEVWNEQNLDREWPTGQISGQTYTQMLQAAYNAIKGANANVMVISGALAPTGAEGAFPGQVINDDHFLQDMVAAGAMNYMDCLGAHYNEGIVGPDQQSGDPRDNYYTRYFWGMVDIYWGITGGQKPLCFTELGYLTPEGYGPLPGFFGWAQNTSVSQQAAWLAQAMALASQSGKVRLVIVFNIDFTAYGADPQGGYAIIRPGGGCPACDAMAAAR